jgi:crooked neck
LIKPENVWKSYINYEISNQEYDKVRSLYERLLEKTKHPKVWFSFSKFEQEIELLYNSRKVFEKAYQYFKDKGQKEERLLILENWIKLEENINENDKLQLVLDKRPRKVKRQNVINRENNITEEYYDYIFPDDEDTVKNFKILENALKFHQESAKEKAI